MSENVAALVQPADPQEVIKLLKDLLSRARAGEFEACVFVGLRADQTFSCCMSGMRSTLTMIGALELAKSDVVSVTFRALG